MTSGRLEPRVFSSQAKAHHKGEPDESQPLEKTPLVSVRVALQR